MTGLDPKIKTGSHVSLLNRITLLKPVLILGIETSCDETGVALYDGQNGLLGHVLHSQIPTHQAYGGVVPELASRDHIRKLSPLVLELLTQTQRSLGDIDGIAYTAGPGLVGALMAGASLAKSLALALDIPAIGIHHMEGHLLAPLMEDHPPEFPFLALLVSGGHTQLVAVRAIGEYTILGESIDDAAGEAFDKTAKMMGLAYPGGPEIARLAAKGRNDRFKFPRPMTDRPGLDFSFSGLKTHTLVTLNATDKTAEDMEDVAACFQAAVIETLLIKIRRALEQTGFRRLVVAGGVSANREMRAQLEAMAATRNVSVHFPRLEFCGDNGAMIAFAGWHRLKAGQQEDEAIRARPRWPIDTLERP